MSNAERRARIEALNTQLLILRGQLQEAGKAGQKTTYAVLMQSVNRIKVQLEVI